jgi:hypothetical protein
MYLQCADRSCVVELLFHFVKMHVGRCGVNREGNM